MEKLTETRVNLHKALAMGMDKGMYGTGDAAPMPTPKMPMATPAKTPMPAPMPMSGMKRKGY